MPNTGAVDAHSSSNLIVTRSKFISNEARKSVPIAINSNGVVLLPACFNKTEQGKVEELSQLPQHQKSISGEANLLTIQQREEQVWQLYKIVLYHLFNFNVNVSRTISDGIVQIHSNAATKSGGGIHLSDSNLYFRMETNISYNQANASGGGVHACS